MTFNVHSGEMKMLADLSTPAQEHVPLIRIATPHVGHDGKTDRLRAPDMETVAQLADSIARQGLLQPIGLQRLDVPPERIRQYRLIWGCQRLLAYHRLHDQATDPDNAGAPTQWSSIPAVVYPADLPAAWLAILEIEENLRRKELTTEEKAEHTLRLTATLKEIENQKTLTGSDFAQANEDEGRPTTGRGHKGTTQKVAERLGIDQGAVRKRVRRAAETIGETVDLERDQPAELNRKAEKLRQMTKTFKADRKAARKAVRSQKAAAPKPEADLGQDLARLNAAWPQKKVIAFGKAMTDQQRRLVRAHVGDLKFKLRLIGDAAAERPEPAEPEPERQIGTAQGDPAGTELPPKVPLVCRSCAQSFEREPGTRGRPPLKCPACRAAAQSPAA